MFHNENNQKVNLTASLTKSPHITVEDIEAWGKNSYNQAEGKRWPKPAFQTSSPDFQTSTTLQGPDGRDPNRLLFLTLASGMAQVFRVPRIVLITENLHKGSDQAGFLVVYKQSQ